MTLEAFHFLRPWWLLLLPLLWGMAFWKYKQHTNEGSWEKLIDTDLLDSLRLDQEKNDLPHPQITSNKAIFNLVAHLLNHLTLFPLLAFFWTLCLLALAGPTWKKIAVPTIRPALDWVLILDLSPSMNETDVAPTRLTRARYAIQDMLDNAHGARIGLIVFGEDAYTVSPLTDDIATLKALLAPLDTTILPTSGNQLAPALKQAEQLLQQGGSQHGQIIVFTDGIEDPAASLKMAQTLHNDLFKLTLVNAAGKNLPSQHHADSALLQQLAIMGGGHYLETNHVSQWAEQQITPDTPLDALLQNKSNTDATENPHIDHWEEAGIWLLPGMLILGAFFFRRGWL